MDRARAAASDRIHRAGGHPPRGATLPEVVVAVAVLGLLLGRALPQLDAWAASARLTSLSNTLLFNMYLARSEAIKRNARVAMCKSADGASCTRAGGWEQGLIVFHDANNNARREPTEVLIHHEPGLPGGWRVIGNASVRDYLSYGPEGMTRMESGAFQAGTITLCRAALATESRQIVVNSSGRPRVQRAGPDACV